jgi:hypothetical protein
MPSTQSAYAIAFCALGTLALVVAQYQGKRQEIGKVQLISPRGKHAAGLVFIVIGVLIFAAKLMIHR